MENTKKHTLVNNQVNIPSNVNEDACYKYTRVAHKVIHTQYKMQ